MISPHPKLWTWLGGPGTGKTSKLIEQFRAEVFQRGTDLEDVRYVTFSRAQRADVVNRLKGQFPRQLTILKKTVRTMHSAVLESLRAYAPEYASGWRPIDEVGQPYHYQTFASLVGLPYRWRDPTLRGDVDREPRIGNALFAVSGFIRQHYGWTPDDWERAVARTGLQMLYDLGDPAAAIQSWWAYKRENKLFEHDDYLHAALELNVPAPARVIFIDEAQDLSPVQFVIFDRWLEDRRVDRIFMGGDPFQAIYGFRGADPQYLIAAHNLAHNDNPPTDRPRSYRCTENAIQAADTVLGHTSYMAPAKPGGEVRWVQMGDDTDFVQFVEQTRDMHGRLLILARYTHHVVQLSDALLHAGVPHTSLTGRLPAWDTVDIDPEWAPRGPNGRISIASVSMERLLVALRGYQRGTLVPVDAARDLVRVLPIDLMRRSQLLDDLVRAGKRGRLYPLHNVFGWMESRPDVYSVLRNLKLRDARPTTDDEDESFSTDTSYLMPQDVLERALLRGGDALPASVALDTLHAAKGLESPAVLVFTMYSARRYNEVMEDPVKLDEEKRVYYVGLSRSSGPVFLSDGYTSAVTNPVVDPLRG